MRPRSLLLVFALSASMLALPHAAGAEPREEPVTEHTYITMPDGVEIAVAIQYPAGYDPDAPEENPNGPDGWPTLFQMDGYAAGGSDGVSTSAYGNRYVTVYASIRGTGCSGGRFDLFDRTHAQDGRFIIDRWIPKQAPWSNGEVGIVGHSYPGLTGWLVAGTEPADVKQDALEVVAISGLIDDLYRGIVYPGGVPNYGFPAIWTGAYRPAVEAAGNAGRLGTETTSGDPRCAENTATSTAERPWGIPDDPILQGLTSREDDTWYQDRSLNTYLDGITKPIHMTTQFQDEQTGPRGPHTLFEGLDDLKPDLPKRFVMTNGVHSTTSVAHADRVAWLDCWLYGDGDAASDWCADGILDPAQRVRVHYETPRTDPAANANDPYTSSDWPLPETQWTRWFLHDDGTLSTDPDADGGSGVYASTPTGRHATEDVAIGPLDGNNGIGDLTFASGPDELTWDVTFSEDTAIAGPINLTLLASSTAPDTDFFVDVLDVGPDGGVQYLQRGLQRASHRAIDDGRSDKVEGGPEDGSYYRAHHPHTNTTLNLLTPGEPTKFEIEVFPLAHLFRAGHTLQLRLHAPPAKDPLSIYAWASAQPPAVNTVYSGAVDGFEGAQTSILLPMLASEDTAKIDRDPEAPACGSLAGVPCFRPVG